MSCHSQIKLLGYRSLNINIACNLTPLLAIRELEGKF